MTKGEDKNTFVRPTKRFMEDGIDEIIAAAKRDFFKVPEDTWDSPARFLDEDHLEHPDDYLTISRALKAWLVKWFGDTAGEAGR